MPPGPPPPDGSLDGPIAVLRHLKELEDGGNVTDLSVGPLSAYLMIGVLTGSLRTTAASGSVAVAGERTRAELRRAAGESPWRYDGHDLAWLYAQLDEMSDEAGPNTDVPGEYYVELIAALQQAEGSGERLQAQLGPLTLYLTISLLQMGMRHPAVAGFLGDSGSPQSPVEMIARGLAQNFGGYARQLIESGFDPSLDVDRDGHPLERADEHLMSVGLAPDDIYDVVTVASPVCPRCGSNPALALSQVQAFCDNDDCGVLMWNPQETAEEFEATCKEQVLVVGDDGVTRNVDADQVPAGAEILHDLNEYFGAGRSAPVVEPIDEQRSPQHRGDADEH